MTCKSYCLLAGHLWAKKAMAMCWHLFRPQKEVVIRLLKSAGQHANVQQRDIQIWLWAIIARTKFANMSTNIKLTASTLLSPQELLMLEGVVLAYYLLA